MKTTIQITDILTGGKISQVNWNTGMDTAGLLAQLGLMNPFNRKQETEADYLINFSSSGFDIRETTKFGREWGYKGQEPGIYEYTSILDQ